MADRIRPEMIVVVGLGRFGSALATELQHLGHEVLGIDTDEQLVQAASNDLTYVVKADATDEAALRQLGVNNVRHAIVAIGDVIQASILATATLSDIGVGDIWAKAQTEQHSRILERVGAHHVVFPERDMGQRVAHRVTGHMLEFIQIDESFTLVETTVPASLAGRTLLESGIRATFGVNVVAVKSGGANFTHPGPDTRLGASDLILVSGELQSVERFAAER